MTATVQVDPAMAFTARRDPQARLDDYRTAFAAWLRVPAAFPLVLVENSGYDLAEFEAMAAEVPGREVELLRFAAPPFDGALGKGYGEMLCLQHALRHSRLLGASAQFIKVTGRYALGNAAEVVGFVAAHPEADVLSNLYDNLTWADSRVFAGRTRFLAETFCPMLGELNDTEGRSFERVLARAIHLELAAGRTWQLLPMRLEVQGYSGSHGRRWSAGRLQVLKQRLRQKLFERCLSTYPE